MIGKGVTAVAQRAIRHALKRETHSVAAEVAELDNGNLSLLVRACKAMIDAAQAEQDGRVAARASKTREKG